MRIRIASNFETLGMQLYLPKNHFFVFRSPNKSIVRERGKTAQPLSLLKKLERVKRYFCGYIQIRSMKYEHNLLNKVGVQFFLGPFSWGRKIQVYDKGLQQVKLKTSMPITAST